MHRFTNRFFYFIKNCGILAAISKIFIIFAAIKYSFKMKKESNNNKKNNLTEDFNMIMQDYQNNNPILNQTWNKKGDYYEQYSVYDENAVTISGILN